MLTSETAKTCRRATILALRSTRVKSKNCKLHRGAWRPSQAGRSRAQRPQDKAEVLHAHTRRNAGDGLTRHDLYRCRSFSHRRAADDHSANACSMQHARRPCAGLACGHRVAGHYDAITHMPINGRQLRRGCHRPNRADIDDSVRRVARQRSAAAMHKNSRACRRRCARLRGGPMGCRRRDGVALAVGPRGPFGSERGIVPLGGRRASQLDHRVVGYVPVPLTQEIAQQVGM